MAAMTPRQRMLALVAGRPHDRVPFVQYANLGGPDEEVRAAIGDDRIGVLQWTRAYRLVHPHCRFETEPIRRGQRQGWRRTLHTPAGSLVEEKLIEPGYGSAAITKHFVVEPEDYRVLLAFLRDASAEAETSGLEKVIAELGEGGLPHTAVMRTAYQQLWVEWVSIEDLVLHLVDLPDRMEEVFAELTRLGLEACDVSVRAAGRLPVPYLNFPDNITAPVIGEPYFRRYCLPMYRALAERIDAAGLEIPIAVHADGDLRPLHEAFSESPVRLFDSFSPPPDNDTRVAEARRLWPDVRICLNFPSSVHLAPGDAVYRKAMEILEEGGREGRIQIQVSENVPRDVWRTSYPAIARAIEDFGPPC